MASRRLRRLAALPAGAQQKFEAHSIETAEDFFRRSELDLVHVLDVSAAAVSAITEAVCRAVCPRPSTALELLAAEREEAREGRLCVVPGLEATEARAGSIAELVGPAGAGKTQACMMMAVTAALPASFGGLGGGVVWVDSEGAFAPQRLEEMARARLPAAGGEEADEAVRALMLAVTVFRVKTTAELVERCADLQATVIEKGARLVVVDSVASPVRASHDRNSLPQRQEQLSELSASLKRLAREFRVPVVVTNQVTSHRRRLEPPPQQQQPLRVTDDVEDRHGTFARPAEEQAAATAVAAAVATGGDDEAAASVTALPAHLHETVLTAALGVGWAHAVNTRFLLDPGPDADGLRRLRVAKSPVVPLTLVRYRIDGSGIVPVGPAEVPSGDSAGSVLDARVTQPASKRARP